MVYVKQKETKKQTKKKKNRFSIFLNPKKCWKNKEFKKKMIITKEALFHSKFECMKIIFSSPNFRTEQYF